VEEEVRVLGGIDGSITARRLRQLEERRQIVTRSRIREI
jgi:hypothetical protein